MKEHFTVEDLETELANVSNYLPDKPRPQEPLSHTLRFVLRHLAEDKTKRFEDIVAGRCTYEELIGCLLQCLDMQSLEDSNA